MTLANWLILLSLQLPPLINLIIALSKIRKLYAMKEDIRGLPAAEKLARRQQESKPLLDDLPQWLQKKHHPPGT